MFENNKTQVTSNDKRISKFPNTPLKFSFLSITKKKKKKKIIVEAGERKQAHLGISTEK